MDLQRGFENPAAYRGGYVSIGNFDGVHRGHQSIVSTLVAKARQAGVPAVVLTFNPHPIHLLRPHHAPPSLSSLDRKAELLQGCGIDCVIAYPTDEALLDLTPEQLARWQEVMRPVWDQFSADIGPEQIAAASNVQVD